MSTNTLIDKIDHLPSVLRRDLDDYLTLLTARNANERSYDVTPPKIVESGINMYTPNYHESDKKPKLKREFGALKGFVTYMADDFDAPLDEFKDYM